MKFSLYYENKKLEIEVLYESPIGKIKEYYNNGKLRFEGEVFNNRKYNGKGYDENGNLIYELKNGTGKIKEFYFGRLFFEGEYLNEKRTSKGKIYELDYLEEFDFFESEDNKLSQSSEDISI